MKCMGSGASGAHHIHVQTQRNMNIYTYRFIAQFRLRHAWFPRPPDKPGNFPDVIIVHLERVNFLNPFRGPGFGEACQGSQSQKEMG